MSPASADGLHVERYIGGYLIANSARDRRKFDKPPSKPQHYASASPNVYRGGYVAAGPLFRPSMAQNSWTGVPLISTAAADRRNRRPPNNHPNNGHHHRNNQPPFPRQPVRLDFAEAQLPLSRLALHARGAPLILSRRYNNNNNSARKSNCINNNNNNNINYNKNYAETRPASNADFAFSNVRDSLPKDVSSFESKERSPTARGSAPPNVDSLSVTSDESSGSANSETCLPRIIKPRKRRKKDRKPPTADKPTDDIKIDQTKADVDENVQKTLYLDTAGSPRTDTSSSTRSSRAADDDSDDSSSLFEAISRCSPTVCECKYCDASEQLWDFDRFCYSSLFSSPSEGDVAHPTSVDDDSPLKRSWSEPCPGYSVESLRITDDGESSNSGSSFGPIGAGRRPKSQEVSDWKATTVPQSPERVPEILFECFPSRGVSLEVSPSIVTSMSGYRDLEIKFFSTKEDSSYSSVKGENNNYQCEPPVAVQ